jgi:hypothetical protein
MLAQGKQPTIAWIPLIQFRLVRGGKMTVAEG